MPARVPPGLSPAERARFLLARVGSSMIYCTHCDSRVRCRAVEACHEGYTLVQRYEQQQAADPAPHAPVRRVPVDVPPPSLSTVAARKPPAPRNQPKPPVNKSPLSSLTIRGAIVSALALVIPVILGLFGVEVTASEIEGVLAMVVGLIGFVMTIIGRLRAG